MTTVYMGGKALRLRDEDLLGEGGEGRVYRAGDRAIKVFTSPTAERRAKLAAFPAALPAEVVGPLEPCTDRDRAVVGYAMRVVEGAIDMHKVAQRKWQRSAMSPRELLAVLRDLANVLGKLHARGVVVGDLNDGNVALEPARRGGLAPCLIDADSMQYAGFPCTVAHERFLDPRLFGVDLAKTHALSRESDLYALAVLAFTSLLFVHPFGGAHPSHPTLLRRAEARCSVLCPDVKLPASAQRPEVLPDDALAWFHRVFEKDAREPLPAALLEAPLALCSCGATHARRACPMCTVEVRVTPPVRAKGRVRSASIARGRLLAASADGTIAWVEEKDGAVVREDGRIVSPTPVRGALRVAGPSTWILSEGRAWRVEQERVVETVAVGTVHGEPAADAGPGGLVYASGDQLVRASDGTRLGKILEGQTHVRVGARVGFAFYRAGAFTHFFVFDVRRGPLRQVGLPHLEGRLASWECVFDDGHVLFSAATEKDGRVAHEAHLVDARGEVVASERGAAGACAILGHVTGKCLAGGAVIVASDDGLVLLRGDRRTRSFVTVRAFPETRDLVPAGADVLVGPGGSLYVLTHDELDHLRFIEGNPSP
jgi:hypothetical protein